MTTAYEIVQRAVAVQLPSNPAMTETYVRSLYERLLSWPWRPFQRIGERPTVYARLAWATVNARDEMLRITGISYEMLGVK